LLNLEYSGFDFDFEFPANCDILVSFFLLFCVTADTRWNPWSLRLSVIMCDGIYDFFFLAQAQLSNTVDDSQC